MHLEQLERAGYRSRVCLYKTMFYGTTPCVFYAVLGFAFYVKPLSLRRWDKEKHLFWDEGWQVVCLLHSNADMVTPLCR